jgi:beta-glucanase (GH16 family)
MRLRSARTPIPRLALATAVTAAALVAGALHPCPAGPQPTGRVPGAWSLALDDEFDRQQSLDTAHWSAGWFGAGVTQPVNLYEDDCYDPSQVTFTTAGLNLTAVRKSETCGGTTHPYTTGIVTTDGRFEFAPTASEPVFVEARIYLPAAPDGQIADWPQFWVDGQHWPEDGELDVLEGLAGQACYHFHDTTTPDAPGGCAGRLTGWHTFGAEWTPQRATYYYDGAEVGSIASDITDLPMYLIIDNAVSGYGGPHQFPDTMVIQYVRVWH